MVAKEWTPDNIFDVLADDRVRAILIATDTRPRSVKDLDRVLSASQSSIYKRVEAMVEYRLLDELTRIDSTGHHYSVYTPNFDRIDMRMHHGRFVVSLYVDGEIIELYS